MAETAHLKPGTNQETEVGWSQTIKSSPCLADEFGHDPVGQWRC